MGINQKCEYFKILDVYSGFEHEMFKYVLKYYEQLVLQKYADMELIVQVLKYCGNSLMKKDKLGCARIVYYRALMFGWDSCRPVCSKSELMAKLCNNIAITYFKEQEFANSKIWTVLALKFNPKYKKCEERLQYINHK